jgi:hypothetical protein
MGQEWSATFKSVRACGQSESVFPCGNRVCPDAQVRGGRGDVHGGEAPLPNLSDEMKGAPA